MKQTKPWRTHPPGPLWFATGVLALTAASWLPAALAAPPEPPVVSQHGAAQGAVLTLKAAIDEALRNAPIVRAAACQTAAAQEQVKANRGLRVGELDVALTAQRLQDAQLLRPIGGPLPSPAAMAALPFKRDQMHVGLVYTYPLYDGKRIASRIELAKLGADQAAALLSGTRADVKYNVTALFAQAQALEAQAEAVQQEIDALEATRRRVELGVKLGKRAGIDLLKIKDRVAEATANKAAILARREQVVAALMKVLGRDASRPIVLAPLPEASPKLAAKEADLETAAAKRSSVTAATVSAAQQKQQEALARAALKPMVALEAEFFRHVDPTDLDGSQETWFVGLKVGLPLFDGGARRAAVRKIRQQAAAARARAEAARLQAVADLRSALADWNAVHEKLKAADAQYAAAKEVARIEQLRYDTGAGDIEDLLRARTREVSARSARIGAQALLVVSAARINHVVEQEVVR